MSFNIKSFAKKVWSKALVRYAIVLIAGVVIGAIGMNRYDHRHPTHATTSGSNSSAGLQKQLQQDSKERLEKRSKQIQDQIAADVKNKQLTQKQADALKKKLDEAYKVRQGLDITKPDDRKKLQDKRQEWRKWAKDNNISYRYFVWLY